MAEIACMPILKRLSSVNAINSEKRMLVAETEKEGIIWELYT